MPPEDARNASHMEQGHNSAATEQEKWKNMRRKTQSMKGVIALAVTGVAAGLLVGAARCDVVGLLKGDVR